MDVFTVFKRSEIMSRISGKNTSPELVVRKILFGLGCRYRLHDKKLCGKPDIVIRRLKTVIFVNGCFWHQHKGCRRNSSPKTNIEYWKPKLKRNVEKQKRNIKELEKLEWKTFIIWECETKDKDKLLNLVQNNLEVGEKL